MSYYLSTINRPLYPSDSVWGNFDVFDSLLRDLSTFSPSFEVQDGENAFFLTLSLPGFKRNEVNVEVQRGNTLSVTARKGDKTSSSSISRSLSLGDDVDPEKVSAKLEDGILTITCPKRDLPKPRKIELT